MVITLNELSQLKETNFGQPDPRHGLRLLWWFADECVDNINGNMIALFNPADGHFGFRRFYNRIEDDEDRLLPMINLPYYEVGNLSSGSLPKDVTANYNRNHADSNADRIIVRFQPNPPSFDRIYVTQHSDQINFNANTTYRISHGLLKTIKTLRLEDFLKRTRNDSPFGLIFQPRYNQVHSTHLQSQHITYQATEDSTCLYICMLIFLIIMLALFIFIYVNMKTVVKKQWF
ncbi:hypothetical protein E1301_Tti012128 [Triplophysa tibetana]|uniref:Uncharacterized protein n=1 Tax=Triplophysa tibetana TaxID=1572043 RepID=A0A5A9PI47_9TELE|nr:hypothetical protein E1301_Tti012128 [Triplophysa tibetana]